MRLAVARLWFCSNSFSARTGHAGEWVAGDAAFERQAADSEIAGLRAFMAQQPDWAVTMLRCASAEPGGPLTAALFGSWLSEVEDALRRGRFDAVYLSLHGACQADGEPSADLTILRRVRSIVGRTPVVASFDLRANLSEEAAILLDGASARRGWPDGGGFDAATRALGLLRGLLSGAFRPVGVLMRLPMVLADVHVAEALGELWRDVLPTLRRPILEASVFSGFAWGDNPYAGPSALVWADRDAGAAREIAAELAVKLSRWSGCAGERLLDPPAAIAAAVPKLNQQLPVLLLEPADDPANGGQADRPELLRAVLGDDAGARFGGPVLVAAFHDPELTTEASAFGVGGELDCVIGGDGGVVLKAKVVATGREPCDFAVLQVGVVAILVAARRVTVTPDRLASFGLRVGSFKMLVAKGGAMSRAAFVGHVAEIIACDTDGPVTSDLLRLPYLYVQQIRRTASNEVAGNRVAPPGALIGRLAARLNQGGADQTDRGHEKGGADAEQQGAKALGAQRH